MNKYGYVNTVWLQSTQGSTLCLLYHFQQINVIIFQIVWLELHYFFFEQKHKMRPLTQFIFFCFLSGLWGQEEEHVVLSHSDVFSHLSSPPSPLDSGRPRPHRLHQQLFRVTKTPAAEVVQYVHLFIYLFSPFEKSLIFNVVLNYILWKDQMFLLKYKWKGKSFS